MASVAEREAEAARLEREIAEVCGVLNAATGRLVCLISSVLEAGSWEGFGIRSPEQWVAWRCGVSGARAKTLVIMARRLRELPETRAGLECGELAEDQVAVICRHAPTHADAPVARFGRQASVSQLRRVLVDYTWQPDPTPSQNDAVERRRVSFGHRDDGSWRMSAVLPPDEGALVERALDVARQSLWSGADTPESRHDVTWPDALVTMADRSLGADAAARPHHQRHTVLVHIEDRQGAAGHLHLGPHLPDALRRCLGCDGRARAVTYRDGVAVSVGRARRIVPERTRITVEERDRGCRVPGCGATKGLEIHHVVHWEEGGRTDTANLMASCRRHHRLHHLGQLGITGNADERDGLVFTDHRGRRLTGSGRPAPPRHTQISGTWVHPRGERLDGRWLHFAEPA